jgi:hypothetical protein
MEVWRDVVIAIAELMLLVQRKIMITNIEKHNDGLMESHRTALIDSWNGTLKSTSK